MSKNKKKGLSLEEKRQKMMEVFYESQDFYLLKELEKKGPTKGVISQSVKDVVQSLVDDDLACRDKIGTSVYFWALPSQAGNQLRQAKMKCLHEIASSSVRIEELQSVLAAMQIDREYEGRELRMEALGALEEENKRLKEEVEKYTENDPEFLARKRQAIGTTLLAVNRWTDNILALQQWCWNNFPHAKENLMALFSEAGVTDDFDYIEE